MSNFIINVIGIFIILSLLQYIFRNKFSNSSSKSSIYKRRRAQLKKTDEERIGERTLIERAEKKPVEVNLYKYDAENPVPVIFVMHGGAFMDGDADQIDSFCARIRDAWKCMIVSVNYTKIDEEKIPYQQEELIDVMCFMKEHANEYHINPTKMGTLGFSAGAYLTTGAAILAETRGIFIKQSVQFYPFLDDSIINLTDQKAIHFSVLVVTCNQAEENRRVGIWVDHMKEAGTDYQLKEYPDALQGFIEYANDEYLKNPKYKRLVQMMDQDQIDMARSAEMYIGNVFQAAFENDTRQ